MLTRYLKVLKCLNFTSPNWIAITVVEFPINIASVVFLLIFISNSIFDYNQDVLQGTLTFDQNCYIICKLKHNNFYTKQWSPAVYNMNISIDRAQPCLTLILILEFTVTISLHLISTVSFLYNSNIILLYLWSSQEIYGYFIKSLWSTTAKAFFS